MRIPFQTLLEVAHELANAAGVHTLSHFRKVMAVDNKNGAGFDPVTAADRNAEAAMRAIIAQKFPDHGILGEEFEPRNEGADYLWTLDPIDGTRPYILGLPLWGTLIGLQHEGAPVLGVMDQPFIGERFWCDEEAAYYRGPSGAVRRCATRKGVRLEDALLTASSPDMFTGAHCESFTRLARNVRMQRFGGDCYAYCMLALGHIDLVAEANLKPFDIVPLVPIIEKAGGAVASWDGGTPLYGGACVACGDPGLLPAALAVLGAST